MQDSKLKKIFLLILVSVLSKHVVSAECQSAIDFSNSFFKNDRLFHAQEPKLSKEYVTTQFFTSLNRNWECANKNGGFCDDVEPWSNSNGISLDSPASVSLISESESEAKVKFEFEYKWNASAKPQAIVDYIVLKKVQRGCWKVDDFILSSGESLSKIYSSFNL